MQNKANNKDFPLELVKIKNADVKVTLTNRNTVFVEILFKDTQAAYIKIHNDPVKGFWVDMHPKRGHKFDK